MNNLLGKVLGKEPVDGLCFRPSEVHSFLSRLVSRRSSLEPGLLTTGSHGIRIRIYICIYIFL